MTGYTREPTQNEVEATHKMIKKSSTEGISEKSALDVLNNIRDAVSDAARNRAYVTPERLPVMSVQTQVTVSSTYNFPRIKSRAVVDNGKFVEFVIGEQVRVQSIETLQDIHQAIGDFLNAIGEGEAKQIPATNTSAAGPSLSGC